jgi:hypothetical protein
MENFFSLLEVKRCYPFFILLTLETFHEIVDGFSWFEAWPKYVQYILHFSSVRVFTDSLIAVTFLDPAQQLAVYKMVSSIYSTEEKLEMWLTDSF